MATSDAPTQPAASREAPPFQTTHKIRLVTATALFDGHDASINIMRRIAQAAGAEVIHLGHNRSVREIVDAAIQEDAQGIAITSYQGGHNEFFRYAHDMLKERGCGHVRLFGGGGGVILPEEIEALHEYGVECIYSPDDGRRLGLQGMVHDMLKRCDFAPARVDDLEGLSPTNARTVASVISQLELDPDSLRPAIEAAAKARTDKAPVLGITGTGGAGKSSLIDELVRRYLLDFPDKTIAILCVDPSRRKTGGALLGDRIRMNSLQNDRAYMRSLATRRANLALSAAVNDALLAMQAAQFDLILLESSGIGQSDSEITEFADVSLYVMTPEYGAATQLEKIDMLDYADVVAINKFDRRGAQDALRDVRKQYKRNRETFHMADADVPVFGTMASQFNDPGTNALYKGLVAAIDTAAAGRFSSTLDLVVGDAKPNHIIPGDRARYLAEIAEENRRYDAWAQTQAEHAETLYRLEGAAEAVSDDGAKGAIRSAADGISEQLDPACKKALDGWDGLVESYRADEFVFKVRDKEIKVPNHTVSLSGLKIPKVSLPAHRSWGDRLRWITQENVPGKFPFTAGVFPFKRTAEDPTRMFAGEGGPERTNRRFHYLAADSKYARLSTAFDSVTLYGEDPDRRPDIYGKVGNAGVSICSVDDAKKLYSGFDLCDALTSVSMTINGPAPMLLAFFMNAAIDQQCEKYIDEHGDWDEVNKTIDAIYAARGTKRPSYHGDLPETNNQLGLRLLGTSGDQVLPADVYADIKARTLATVRGTVQADILKEDQAQNTCIFSTEFALRMMGDIQEFFTEKKVRNFYSVSISGYHIAEAGANPITQLAFTLSNGFTYVEYYLSRGLSIDDFAPNLSFFFSNGVDAEYSVIGRVARRLWAKAIKHRYGGNERSQKLKYHIQTSGRSLHAQEIQFNDIRTTLQALYAIYDNCNSLHTNAFDEAITTPTEDSVRRAMAIQLIINRELGLATNENPLQGSFIIEELTDLVEEAVYAEFIRISERGGVLGAMETMYQRGQIQEESLHYETLKSTGEMPIIGVNTFLGKDGSPIERTDDVMRSSDDEKDAQIAAMQQFQSRDEPATTTALETLRQAALRPAGTNDSNVFEALMDAVKVCTLGQISGSLYGVGGQYRRNM